MKNFTYILLIITVFLAACGSDDTDDNKTNPIIPKDNPIIPKDEKPSFKYTKERVDLFKIKLYSDTITVFKYDTKVTQTNPNVTVPDSVLRHMEDSINNKVIYPMNDNKQTAVAEDMGYDINGNAFTGYGLKFSSYFNGYNPQPSDYSTTNYSGKGREYLIDLYRRQNNGGFISTMEGSTIHIDFWFDYRDNPVGFEKDEFPDFMICGKDYLGYLMTNARYFNLPSGLEQPDKYPIVFLFMYDRFNGRIYKGEDGSIYRSVVLAKKVTEMKDYDQNAVGTKDATPDISKTYPVIQFYKDGELWLEFWIYQYTEWYSRNAEENTTTVETDFDGYTKIGGYQYWIRMDEGNMRMYIDDCSKPDGSNSFTRVDIRNLKFVSDEKANGRPMISTE